MKRLKFYLVGPIQWSDNFMGWREDLREFLEEYGHEALLPWGEIYHGKKGKMVFLNWAKELSPKVYFAKVRKYMRRHVIKWDLKAVEACDGIIFWLPKGIKTVGSYGEITLIYYFIYHKKYSKWKGKQKKIFVITDIPIEELSYWLIGCSDKIFKNFKKFKKYFKENFNQKRKRKRTKVSHLNRN